MPDTASPPPPPQSATNLSTRGPLRYVVDTSSPQITAGPPFSVYVTVTNPYDVLVRVRAITAVIPVEFYEATAQRPLRKRFVTWVQSAASDSGVALGPKYIVGSSAIQSTGRDGGPASAQSELQPGNSMVKFFAMQTNHATFFPPATYNLQFQVEYDIDGHANRDTIGFKLTVRSTLKTLILGGIIGAAVGWMTRRYGPSGKDHNLSLNVIPELLVAALLGGVTVVAFARKRDAQPFIAIEDFWGALFIGFVVGYSGNSVLDKLVDATGATGAAKTPP